MNYRDILLQKPRFIKMGLNRLKDESLFPEMESISIGSLLGNADASIQLSSVRRFILNN